MIDVTKHSSEYYKRMKNSVLHGGKQELIKRVKKGDILDLGTGDGSLAISIKEHFPDSEVYAVDLSTKGKQAMERAGVQFFQQDLSALNKVQLASSGKQFDSIILSSVLHEILSYSEDKQLHTVFLENINLLLKPGGNLLIRDGVQVESTMQEKSLTLIPTEISVGALMDMLAEFEAENLKSFSAYYQSEKFNYHQLEKVGVVIDSTDEILQELIFTLNWGPDSWDREKKNEIISLPNRS
ncbi:methyltransferase [Listeria aquatica]|uniref:methyltransferase n=1 Tax=Listeria aquatica TaxID=1494960 RepID=UPI003F70A643